MEPKSHEQMPSPIETTPGLSPNQEFEANNSHEQLVPVIEYGQEQSPQEQAPAVPAVQLPTPVIAQPMPPVGTTPSITDDDNNPQTAADEDLIEKEWVDKAKKIIAETKDDPYARERQVGRLQADYLKKRYGKELGNQE